MEADAPLWLLAPVVALLAGCLALVPLGTQVVARGVIFIDLAVAQTAACGMLASHRLLAHAPDGHVHEAPTALPLGQALWAALPWAAWLSAAAAALLVRTLARQAPAFREARIGLVYVGAASAALLLAAGDPHGRDLLDTLLAADVLWAPWPQTLLLGLAALLVCTLALARGPRPWPDALFYPVFALTLCLAVPVLGLYLVFALLIGPALWHRDIGSRGTATGLDGGALGCAVLASAAGMALSWMLDWPSGATIALCLALAGVASVFRAAPGDDEHG